MRVSLGLKKGVGEEEECSAVEGGVCAFLLLTI